MLKKQWFYGRKGDPSQSKLVVVIPGGKPCFWGYKIVFFSIKNRFFSQFSIKNRLIFIHLHQSVVVYVESPAFYTLLDPPSTIILSKKTWIYQKKHTFFQKNSIFVIFGLGVLAFRVQTQSEISGGSIQSRRKVSVATHAKKSANNHLAVLGPILTADVTL